MNERYRGFGTYGQDVKKEDVVRAPVKQFTEEERKAQQMYQENIEKLCELFKYRDDVNFTFGPKGSEDIEATFNLLRQQMDKRMLHGDMMVRCDQQCADRVKQALDVVMHEVIFKPHTPILRDIGMEFTRLTLNWAGLIAQRQDLSNQSSAIQRMIRSQLTLEDCIDMIKKLSDQSRRVLEYVPPGFNLSKAYEETLRDDTK